MVAGTEENPTGPSPEPDRAHGAPRRLDLPVPPLDALPRLDLLDRLDSAFDSGQVPLVSAGAGYGKSVLLSSWARRRTETVAWLGLDRRDTEPRQLAGDILGAIQHALGGTPASASFQQLRPPPGLLDPLRFADNLLTAFLDTEVAAANVVLVLDDVHHVSNSRESTELIEYVLRWAPANLRLVLTSRSDPPNLVRLILDGRATVIRQRDLAFSIDETATLLTSSRVELPDASLAVLHETLGGWPAGVRMAALFLQSSVDAVEDVVAFARRDQTLSVYLVGEVLNHLPTRLREFVLRATIDDEVCAPLISAVTGRTDGEAMFAECEAQNLFLDQTRDDSGRRWFTWHSIFASHMRHRLAFEDPTLAQRDQVRAAQWWLHVDPIVAARHLLDGGDAEGAGQVFAQHWLEVSLRGQTAQVLTLAQDLPPTGAHVADTELARALHAIQSGRSEEATHALWRAGLAAQDMNRSTRRLFDAESAVLRLLLVDDPGDLSPAIDSLQDVVGKVGDDARVVGAPAAFLAYGLGMGQVRLQSQLDLAIEQLQRARRLAQSFDLPVIDLLARAELCIPMIATGRLASVAAHAESTLADAEARGWQALPLGIATGYLGWYAYWQDRLDDARTLLVDAVSGTLGSDWTNRCLIVYFHALTSLALGDLHAVQEGIERCELLVQSGSVPAYCKSLPVALRADLAATQGRIDLALQIAETDTQRPAYRLAVCSRADLLRRAGRPEDCLRLLDDVPSQDLFQQVQATVEVTRSLAFQALGETDRAHVALESALANAAGEGLLRPFVARGDEVREPLVSHQHRGTAHSEFVAVVLDRINQVSASTRGGTGPLTPREHGVLVFLTTPMSIEEIAKARFVSINTIKSQLASIYRKLGVQSRRGAVRRADDLGLLTMRPPSS